MWLFLLKGGGSKSEGVLEEEIAREQARGILARRIMMKKLMLILVSVIFVGFSAPRPGMSQDTSTVEIIKEVSGGLSAGYFYASNVGPSAANDNFVLSNLLVELLAEPKEKPISFVAAFGGTVTPSVFDPPEETAPDLGIEYASLCIEPIENLCIETGLLQPSAGYEDTYTFNNRNMTVGAVASQQPYNALGAGASYSIKDVEIYAATYKARLDKEEYCTEVNGTSLSPTDSWEAGIGGSFAGTDLSIYHYNLNSLRNLTGFVVERTVDNTYLALNMDYWRWNHAVGAYFKDNCALATAVYVSPRFGAVSIPVRLEYINQGKSKIYLDSEDAEDIYVFTITPTYNFSENAYIRAEASYVEGDKGFEDDQGNTEDSRTYFSMELGFKF